MLCEREMVTDTKHKMKGVRPPYMSVTGEEDFLNYNAVSPLTNGYCRDTASILGANNLDLLSPLLAMEHEEAFPIAKAFLSHLMKVPSLSHYFYVLRITFNVSFVKLPQYKFILKQFRVTALGQYFVCSILQTKINYKYKIFRKLVLEVMYAVIFIFFFNFFYIGFKKVSMLCIFFDAAFGISCLLL
jgi:hypothetical protein